MHPPLRPPENRTNWTPPSPAVGENASRYDALFTPGEDARRQITFVARRTNAPFWLPGGAVRCVPRFSTPYDRAGLSRRRLAWRSEVGRCSRAVLSLCTCLDGPEDRPTSRALAPSCLCAPAWTARRTVLRRVLPRFFVFCGRTRTLKSCPSMAPSLRPNRFAITGDKLCCAQHNSSPVIVCRILTSLG